MIIMHEKRKKLLACTRPLTGDELNAVEFVDAPDNRIKINGHWITAVFVNKQCLVHPEAVTI